MTPRRTLTTLLVAFVILVASARAVTDRVIEKTFATHAGAIVHADTFSGGIHVTASGDTKVHVSVRQTVAADDNEAARALLAELEIVLRQTNNWGVHLEVTPRRHMRWVWQNWSPAALAIEIAVPPRCRLELRTGEGAITVDSIAGNISATTASGTIFIGEIDGAIAAANGHGDISVTAATGGLSLTAKSGNILIGRSDGTATLAAVDGVIDVQAARGPVLARGDRSDITVGFVHPLREPSALETDGGDVTVCLDPRSGVSLDARSSKLGTVRIRNLEFTAAKGTPHKSAFVGTLNGGGPLVKIRAGGGNARINGVPSI
jgi:hypothetical protein